MQTLLSCHGNLWYVKESLNFYHSLPKWCLWPFNGQHDIEWGLPMALHVTMVNVKHKADIQHSPANKLLWVKSWIESSTYSAMDRLRRPQKYMIISHQLHLNAWGRWPPSAARRGRDRVQMAYCNQGTFFWRKDKRILILELRDGLSAVTTNYCQNVPERSCACDDVICVITSALEDNYIPIEQLTFQSAAAHRPTSLGRAALKIATLQTGRHHLILISVDPPNCVSCVMLARNCGYVDRPDNARSVNST